ncbi:MAG: DNA polymerase Y family protein [Silicimonas sp.]|nr:DNA polymerase Y family protein [Silicimonas sp.]
MQNRRILSLWFPRLAAERALRQGAGVSGVPFAVVGEVKNAQVLVSLSREAEAAGLTRGQALRDGRAICPELQTRLQNPELERAFLTVLRRWAGKFSPWVSEEPPEALMLDLTGCAHLFGGEAVLMEQIMGEAAALGLSLRCGIADTLGAAWALARYAGGGAQALRSGDDIAQEARATRSRAGKRHWVKGGAAPVLAPRGQAKARIAPPGQLHAVLADLPVAALRIAPEVEEMLARLGLRRIGDLAGQPRAGLARRFGRELVLRLDQALGSAPEPVNPARPPLHFAVRLTLPEPVGKEEDIAAALDRLLPALEQKLRAAGQGARVVRLECHRSDHSMGWVEVGLARPSAAPDRIRPLLMMKAGEIEAGFGIDMIRVIARVVEPAHPRQHRGHGAAAADGAGRLAEGTGLEDLLGRLGARIGLEAITRVHPADSHIPEKSAQVLAAAWSDPAPAWPRPPAPRPLELWPPELVLLPEGACARALPLQFRWRGRAYETRAALGPERIAPEWWLDDPHWRTGVRDYWRVTTGGGERLWLYYGHGAALSPGWFCHGRFG